MPAEMFVLKCSDKMEVLLIGPQNLLQYNFNLEGCPITLSTKTWVLY